MIQTVLTIIFYVWLFGILALLWLSYRNSAKHHEAAVTSAQAAKTAAEAAKKLADMLEKEQA
jgi:hypothetical protein